MSTQRIDFVSVDKGDDKNPPSGMDRDGQWWIWDRTEGLWKKGVWTGGLMLTATDKFEK